MGHFCSRGREDVVAKAARGEMGGKLPFEVQLRAGLQNVSYFLSYYDGLDPEED